MIQFLSKYGERVKHDELLSKHTTLHIGGKATWYFEAKTREELIDALAAAKSAKIKVAVLGGGSNSLFLDKGFDGLVLRPMLGGIRIDEKNDTVRGEAGLMSALLARKSAEAGLTGFEWAATLPGTIGGAVRGNAGCFGGEIKDTLVNVEVVKGGEVITIPHQACNFAYRSSAFKQNPDDVILAATFKLQKADRAQCLAKIDEVMAKRKATQPQGTSSAGCMFKNFEFTPIVLNSPSVIPETQQRYRGSRVEKLAEAIKIPEDFLKRGVIPAGWLIEQAELKGFCVGGACVSDVHGNFLVVKPGTTADHILQLTAAIKTKIRNLYGIQLEEEVQLFV